jgi:hypothetical protein
VQNLTVTDLFIRLFPKWWPSFLFTLAVEVPIYTGLVWRKTPAWRAAAAGAACSCVTHPLLWFVWPIFFHSYRPYVISGELIVGVVEAFIFYFLARPGNLAWAFSASFLANAASYGGGTLMHSLGYLK